MGTARRAADTSTATPALPAGTAVAPATPPVVVKPVVNAIRILRHLAQTGKPARAVQIARQLAINPSTCFNILRTLAAEGMVDFNDLSKTYSAGLGLTRLVDRFMSDAQRVQAAKPYMHEVAAEFHVTVTLWRRMGHDRIVLVAVEASPADLRITMSEGQRLPLLMGASGRVFAAQLGASEAELSAQFAKLRWQRPLSFASYMREVRRGERRGWTVDDGFFANGIMTVAAPVRDGAGGVGFTVSAVMFRGQFDDGGIARVGTAMKALGAKLGTLLS